MAEWVHYFNYAAAAGGLMAALLGLLLTLSMPYIEDWERTYFRSMFVSLLVYIASDLVGQTSQYFLDPDFIWLSRAGVFLELFFSMAIVPLFTAYLLRCANEDWHDNALLRGALALWAAYVAILVAAQFDDAVYYFSAAEKCVLPGPFFPALIVVPVLLMVLNLVAFIRRRAALTRRQRAAFAICTVVPLACVFLQAVFFGLSVLVVGTSLSALFMLSLIASDQTAAHVRQLEEASRQRARVMTLQMRPHFIYNVMSSIYYLCAQDPNRAQQVTFDFTNYLRTNFTAVAQEGEVPFIKELEHARAYLNVERARLEDGLCVEVDCPCTAFRLPPLTLQPLVENAIKHGADPELPPLYVRVTTREEPGFWVVSVEDTGPGFDGDTATFDSASALANIRERLEACGSELVITAREGGGTVATIRVPMQECVSGER